MRGIAKMVEDDRYCIDVLTQISAVQKRDRGGRASAFSTTTFATASSAATGDAQVEQTRRADGSRGPPREVLWSTTTGSRLADQRSPSPQPSRLLATVHCLTGCAIGEILGLIDRHGPRLERRETIALAIVLAFFFGYSLTMVPLLAQRVAFAAAIPIALAADTISIAIMEIVDNAIVLAIPGAMEAGLTESALLGQPRGLTRDRRRCRLPGQPVSDRARPRSCRRARTPLAKGGCPRTGSLNPVSLGFAHVLRALRERTLADELAAARRRRRSGGHRSMHLERRGGPDRRPSRDARRPRDARPRHPRGLGPRLRDRRLSGRRRNDGLTDGRDRGRWRPRRPDPQARYHLPACDRGRAARRSRTDGRTCASDRPFVVETTALRGHTDDGTAYRIRELDLLAVGDHLSAVEFPFASTTSDYRTALASLIELLRNDPPAHVVPGHGPALTTAEALTIAEADLAYLRALRDAVAASAQDRTPARSAGLAVLLPRSAPDEFAQMHAGNVEAQLEELLPDGRSNR